MNEGSKRVRALGAFSGGLDGMLAARVLMDQNIHVEAVTFDSPFFDVDAGRRAAKELGIPWRGVDITGDILALLESPPSGFGKNMNPCIDCHAIMFRRLAELAWAEGFDFIFSGEVVGQRPMSQNRGSLNRVRNLSGTAGVLLRPLSARILDPTPMEEQGLVDRDGLLGLNGRGRTAQLELAERYGFKLIPAPAGGCLLTDPGYSKRLRVLKEHGLLSAGNARMIRLGRMFILKKAIGIAGRSEAENRDIGREAFGCLIDLADVPSPLGTILGEATEENIRTLAAIMASYTRGSGPFTAVTARGSFETGKMDPATREGYTVIL